MAAILHLSFRVKEPQRSAELSAELLGGHLIDSGPQLGSIGVKSIAFGDEKRGAFLDMIEFWPQDKHWAGEFIPSDGDRLLPFGHLAFQTKKSEDELAAIAKNHGAVFKQEERGLPELVPVVYDFEGNFLEFFPPINA